MTNALFEQIADSPDEPVATNVSDLFSASSVVEEVPEPPKRTRRGPGRPRKEPQYDPETGEEIKPERKQYTPRNAKLQEELLEGYVAVASEVAIVAPTLAGVLIARAEVTVDGLVKLASGNKKLTALLKKSTSVSKYAEIGQTILLCVLAGAVDFGRIDPSSPILSNIGYAEIVRKEDGKPARDSRGLLQKEYKTLREIYDTMHKDQPAPEQEQPMPEWNGTQVGNGITIPPMNWTPRG